MKKNNKGKTGKKAKKSATVAEVTHKLIGETVKKGGFLMTQIKREGDVAIFQKERIKKPWCDHYQAGYEVVVIKRHNGYTLGKQVIEPAETYPCKSLWGILGWSCMDLDSAEIKFKQVMAKIKAREIDLSAETVGMEDDTD